MDLTLRLVGYVLALNAFLVFWAIFLRSKIWLRSQKRFDIKEFLAGLPRGTKLVDPWILVDGKWVKTSKASYHPSPAT
jgi:hypothetical protein